jgi:hypothetical protein
MTNQEVNKIIAEYCGWKHEFNGDDEDPEWYWIPPNNPDGNESPPDYCNDLNAIHDAEKNLIRGDPGLWECYTNRLNTKYGIDAIHATARERAETFLKTIGKWKE